MSEVEYEIGRALVNISEDSITLVLIRKDDEDRQIDGFGITFDEPTLKTMDILDLKQIIKNRIKTRIQELKDAETLRQQEETKKQEYIHLIGVKIKETL